MACIRDRQSLLQRIQDFNSRILWHIDMGGSTYSFWLNIPVRSYRKRERECFMFTNADK